MSVMVVNEILVVLAQLCNESVHISFEHKRFMCSRFSDPIFHFQGSNMHLSARVRKLSDLQGRTRRIGSTKIGHCCLLDWKIVDSSIRSERSVLQCEWGTDLVPGLEWCLVVVMELTLDFRMAVMNGPPWDCEMRIDFFLGLELCLVVVMGLH